MLILIVHSQSVMLIILSLPLEYYELYCLDLGDSFLFARLEILNLPTKFLFVNNSFSRNNWRCLPTQLLSYHTHTHIYIYIYTAVHCKCQILFYGQNYAGEVSKFKFRSLSLICAVIHLSSISGRSSKQKKNSKFIVGRSQKSGAPRYRAVGGQTHAGEVSKLKFRSLSLICAVIHFSSISGRS